MSYNISAWHTIRHDNFQMHSSTLKRLVKNRPESFSINHNYTPEEYLEEFFSSRLRITDISARGEGSGRFWNDSLLEAFEETTGKYKAVISWEGGDSIYLLTVIDGEVRDENLIDLLKEGKYG